MAEEPTSPTTSQRIDQWLWFARIVKSRTLAQALIERGKVRVNRTRIDKASTLVKAGDVLTLSLGPKVRVIAIDGFGERRGPATEAARLYRELTEKLSPATSPAADGPLTVPAARPQGAGRPTKRDRRAIDRLKGLR